jgi:hypothetical protein
MAGKKDVKGGDLESMVSRILGAKAAPGLMKKLQAQDIRTSGEMFSMGVAFQDDLGTLAQGWGLTVAQARKLIDQARDNLDPAMVQSMEEAPGGIDPVQYTGAKPPRKKKR